VKEAVHRIFIYFIIRILKKWVDGMKQFNARLACSILVAAHMPK